MKITHLRTNHIKNPLGFTLDTPRLSWQVTNAKGKRQESARVQVAEDAAFVHIVYDTGWKKELSSLAVAVPVSLAPCTRYYWKVAVLDECQDLGESETAWFETGKKTFAGRFITANSEEAFPLQYVQTFQVAGSIKKARAYACGLGFYELSFNGVKAGEEYLAPGLNDYDSWIQTQTYDIKALLQQGDNTVQAITGDGLYKGRFGFEGGKCCIYGEQQAFLCELVITYEDDTTAVFATDLNWSIQKSSIRFADIYDGEVLDDGDDTRECLKTVYADIPMERLIPRLSLPVVEKETRKPEAVLHTKRGETILDMGQNMVGFIRFRNKAKKGERLTLLFGEILQDGCFYRENLRQAKAEFVYISDGLEKEVRPHFTYYGFRYVKLEGFQEPINLQDFTGVVLYSDMEQTGFLSTANNKVNRLFQNILWGQKGNFVDVPTDCPQRDERMGWTGDAQVFCNTAAFNMDIYAFMKKYCHDMKLEQRKRNGEVPMVVPAVGMQGGGSCAWADAATVIPWTVYQFSGDEGILEESYEGMRGWVDYIREKDRESGDHRLFTTGFHFGDWLAPDGDNPNFPTGGTEIVYIASCYYYLSAKIVGKAAGVLGRKEEERYYHKLKTEIGEALCKEYLTPGGRLALTNQTAYALALAVGFVPENKRERVAADFYGRMKKDGGYLRTGFVGTPFLCRMLSEYGYSDMAYQLLFNEQLPSWLYCVNQGATTIWERWDSVQPNGTMNPQGMNSLNHYSYGAVGEWMYRNMAGLSQLTPGFKKVQLAPMIDERLEWVEMEYQSAAGTYKSAWQHKKSGVELKFEVPFDASAQVLLPASTPEAVTVNGKQLAFSQIEWKKEEKEGKIELQLEKGEYRISCK